MSDEIDIQRYIAALRRRWWIVVLVTIVAIAVAVVLGAAQPRHYQATATLLAQAPRYQWRFDAGILPLVDVRRDYQREFLAISRSNQIAERATEALRGQGQFPDASASSLQAAVNVRAAEGSILLVTATASDPQQAAAMANAWANAFIELVKELYGVSADLANFQTELEAASQRLAQWEEKLAQVRTETGLYAPGDSPDEGILFSRRQRELDLINQRLAEYLTDLESLRYLEQRLAAAGPDTNLSLLPWELLDGPVLSQRGVITSAVALASLDDPAQLLTRLKQEEESLATTAGELTRQSERVQAELAADWQRYAEVSRQRNLVKETYNLLSRKVEEASIRNRIDPGQLILVSEALPPSNPVQVRRLAQLAVAGVVGLILGVIAALWLDLRLLARGDT